MCHPFSVFLCKCCAFLRSLWGLTSGCFLGSPLLPLLFFEWDQCSFSIFYLDVPGCELGFHCFDCFPLVFFVFVFLVFSKLFHHMCVLVLSYCFFDFRLDFFVFDSQLFLLVLVFVEVYESVRISCSVSRLCMFVSHIPPNVMFAVCPRNFVVSRSVFVCVCVGESRCLSAYLSVCVFACNITIVFHFPSMRFCICSRILCLYMGLLGC